MTQITTLTRSLFDQISQLPEAQQAALAAYLQKHLDQIVAQAEKEHQITTRPHPITETNTWLDQAMPVDEAEMQEILDECGSPGDYESEELLEMTDWVQHGN